MFVAVLLVIGSLTYHTDVVASTHAVTQEQCNDIIHVRSGNSCLSVCSDSSCGGYGCKCFGHLRYDCSEYSKYGFIFATPGYWYDNNVAHYTANCPGEYCENGFQIWLNNSLPDRNVQCRGNWSGYVCGECKGNNSIKFDSMKCISGKHWCIMHGTVWSGWLLVFLVTLLYWCIFILLVVVVLNFKFNISIGYAYGILFYYSVLETLVKQKISDDYFDFDF